MKKVSSKISKAELEIMKVLWLNSPQTANEIIEKLESKIDWKPKTIRTFINRLVQKESVSYH
ncbi:Protein of unknown function [Bacillus cytotoxicus]|uniref:Penicillinase repressor n=1 Tax=Bacillus cytotoxicus TaxID=580165 RepID=A0AAX2CDH3_9BACI|nr:Protein of unknown function [Bacillus cytotoxicus]SCN32344.1 Protein of unknown function [Bacillus cytotoxicus]